MQREVLRTIVRAEGVAERTFGECREIGGVGECGASNVQQLIRPFESPNPQRSRALCARWLVRHQR